MIHTARVGDFRPSVHGLPFSNRYPEGSPVFLFDSPFGPVGIGDAARGLCGGMVYAVIDLHHFGVRAIPDTPRTPVFRYLCRRLFASWGLPFAWMKYWAWQVRPGGSRFLHGVRVVDGVFRRTVKHEWPRIRTILDAGRLAPLGLVKETGWNPLRLGRNHQVLAYGYRHDDATHETALLIYDPNHPLDDGVELRWNGSDPDGDHRVEHSREGPNVRGVFLTEYRPPGELPVFT